MFKQRLGLIEVQTQACWPRVLVFFLFLPSHIFVDRFFHAKLPIDKTTKTNIKNKSKRTSCFVPLGDAWVMLGV
jgi:hypothetical protein